jgi:hypothetical protein
LKKAWQKLPWRILRKKKAGQRKTAYRFFEKSLAKTPVEDITKKESRAKKNGVSLF